MWRLNRIGLWTQPWGGHCIRLHTNWRHCPYGPWNITGSGILPVDWTSMAWSCSVYARDQCCCWKPLSVYVVRQSLVMCYVFCENHLLQTMSLCCMWDAPKVRSVVSYSFAANFIRFIAVQKFVTWQSYREFKGGNFLETQCSSNWHCCLK